MSTIYQKTSTGSGDIISYQTSQTNLNVTGIKNLVNAIVTKNRFRVSILNYDETVREIIPEEVIINGGYNENYQSGQRRTLSLSLDNDLGKYTPSINGLWAGTKMSLDVGLEDTAGEVVWFPKGIYNLISVSSTRQPGVETVSLELSDKFSVLEGKEGTLETSYTIEPGIEIEQLIKDTLRFSKGNGEMLDPKDFIYHSSFKGKTTPATIAEEAGGTMGNVILDLATMLSAEVFYDVEGHLTFVPINYTLDDSDKPTLMNYIDTEGDFASDDLNFDLGEVVNRVVVIGSTVNGQICDAIALNDDVGSPLCYQRIGYRTASPINDSLITTTYLAQERADYELRQLLIAKSSVSHNVRLNPLILVNNLISVNDEFYGFKEESFLVQSISFSLDYSGTMTISCSNVQNFSFLTGGR